MESKLELVCNFEYQKTNIKNIFYTPPYKIMHPFMDGEKMELMLMSSSAGLLAGDRFDCSIEVLENANLTFLSQSYEKILDTKSDRAERHLKIKVADNASLKYMPLPAIPHANSSFLSSNEIEITSKSTLVYSDIFSCGRVGMGERYGLMEYRSKSRVCMDGELVFADHTLIAPKKMNYEALGMWGNYTHSGMLYIYTPEEEKLEAVIAVVRSMKADSNLLAGATRCKKGVLVRSLGYSGEELFNVNKKLGETL